MVADGVEAAFEEEVDRVLKQIANIVPEGMSILVALNRGPLTCAWCIAHGPLAPISLGVHAAHHGQDVAHALGLTNEQVMAEAMRVASSSKGVGIKERPDFLKGKPT